MSINWAKVGEARPPLSKVGGPMAPLAPPHSDSTALVSSPGSSHSASLACFTLRIQIWVHVPPVTRVRPHSYTDHELAKVS